MATQNNATHLSDASCEQNPQMKVVHDENNTSALQPLLPVLSDLRRSAVIISDAIRVRERRVLKYSGLDPHVETRNHDGGETDDLSRCTACMKEFFHPTVVFRNCGHGMHDQCANEKFPRRAKCSPRDLIGFCPTCTKPLACQDLVILKGVVPAVEEAVAWRSILLTEPWAILPDTSEHDEQLSESCLDELLIALRTFFGCQASLSNLINEAMDERNQIKVMELEMEKKYRLLKEDIVRRERSMDEAKDELLKNEIGSRRASKATQDRISTREIELGLKSQELVRQKHEVMKLQAALSESQKTFEKENLDFSEKKKRDLNSLTVERGKIRKERIDLENLRKRLNEKAIRNIRYPYNRRIYPTEDDIEQRDTDGLSNNQSQVNIDSEVEVLDE